MTARSEPAGAGMAPGGSSGPRDGPSEPPARASRRRRIRTAAVLAVGTELTTGATRDSNAAELAAALTAEGVEVVFIGLLPDRLELLVDALDRALATADLVLTSGGLGPTPDDLTREAIAAVCDEEPVVDSRLEAALRRRWLRRGLPYPASNVKQAWRIPSARPIPNPNGTAPGWWVERPDGRLVVALPGPPRELRPMWREWVLGRLRRRGLGVRCLTRTLRTVGIGESQLVEVLGEELLRAENPQVATYARQDGVDVVIVARDEPGGAGRRGRSAGRLLAETEALVRSRLGDAVWGTDGETWASVLGRLLSERGWRLAVVEIGTAGAVVGLLEALVVEGGLVRAGIVASGVASGSAAAASASEVASGSAAGAPGPETERTRALAARADTIRSEAGVEVGLAVELWPWDGDSRVGIAVADPDGRQEAVRTVFGTGGQARIRAAVAAADVLRHRLRSRPDADPGERSAP
ncbi:MAG TPA: molybdopterin-binding protein [Candidatus Binatia bacterium]|nr:molybdopterin-binding protein [Candidatus Binatia bacterium]